MSDLTKKEYLKAYEHGKSVATFNMSNLPENKAMQYEPLLSSVFRSLDFNECYIVKTQKEWDRVKHLLDLRPDICEKETPSEIPFSPTFIKHSTFISCGTLLTYSINNKKGITANWIPAILNVISLP